MPQGMVISLEMQEMKWVTADLNQIFTIVVFVKEQRVDGSSREVFILVRYTLVAGKPVHILILVRCD